MVDLLKNSIAAASSKDGEFVTSTTTEAPARTSDRPSPGTASACSTVVVVTTTVFVAGMAFSLARA